MAGRTPLSIAAKRSVIADIGAGLPYSAIARKFDRSKATICNIAKELRESPIKPEVLARIGDWKSELTELSVSSVRRALSEGDDLYKSAAIGQTHLKGVGEYEPDGTRIQFQQLVQGIPSEWRQAFSAHDTPALDTPQPQAQLPQSVTDSQQE